MGSTQICYDRSHNLQIFFGETRMTNGTYSNRDNLIYYYFNKQIRIKYLFHQEYSSQ